MYSLLFMSCVIIQAFAWEQIPNIPSGHRAQFYILQNDGSYKYGYDAGNGNAAKQSADPSNQVEGHYFYTNPLGQKSDLKYSAGIQGFVPVGLEKVLQYNNNYPPNNADAYWAGNAHLQNYANNVPSSFTNSKDGSYSFGYTSDTQERSEQADANGNVRGRYSYKNPAGTHDLSYVAGSSTGFLPTGGSLIIPPGVTKAQLKGPTGKFELDEEAEEVEPQQPIAPPPQPQQPIAPPSPPPHDNSDGNSDDESDDDSGEYKPDDSGEYVPDNSGEYVPDNGGEYQPGPEDNDESDSSENGEFNNRQAKNSGDASYNFNFDTADYKRSESADANGNVHGSFSYANKEGTHDLQYIAGAGKGFIARSGSLSVPNGLVNGQQNWQALKNSQNSAPSAFVNSNDGSYSFDFSSDDQARSEQSDANGNVRGRYSYKNGVGTHNLNYVAGSATGFLPTGGSLVPAPGLTHEQLRSQFKSHVVVNNNPPAARLQYEPYQNPGNLKLVSYLPSKLNANKYGYIFETN